LAENNLQILENEALRLASPVGVVEILEEWRCMCRKLSGGMVMKTEKWGLVSGRDDPV
jgi:hypothetical protein